MTDWTMPSQLNRVPHLRENGGVDAAWPGARVVEVDEWGNIAAADGRALWATQDGDLRRSDVFIGQSGGVSYFARPVREIEGESVGWRDVDPAEAEFLAPAVMLSRWHLSAPPCERCGEATMPDLGGARRTCVGCGRWVFPRTDPCVIVAITDDDDRLLLARQASWPERRFSIIAGFIEAGESAEQACHREVAEEVGLTLTTVRYVSSQPWPMPRSLMLGFEARAGSTSIAVDGVEIVEASFRSRGEVRGAVEDGSLLLPPGASIAHALINRWLHG